MKHRCLFYTIHSKYVVMVYINLSSCVFHILIVKYHIYSNIVTAMFLINFIK